MIDEILEEALKRVDNENAVETFCKSKIRYLIGRNEISLELNKKIKIDAIIDDFYQQESWNNILIIKSEQIAKNATVINCSTSISPLVTHKKFSTIKDIKLFAYCEIMNKFFIPDFVKQDRQDLKENKSKWQSLYNNFADKESKKVLHDILLYRLTADYQYMKDYSVRIDQQYFEDFMEYNNEIFVDAGGFIGDTSEEFIKRYPDYNHIYFFEPSAKNIAEAKKCLRGCNSIDFIEYALSDSEGDLYFNDFGSSSAVTKSGAHKVNVTTIDKYISGEVSFIKMDLEGFELKALLGAENHIRKYYPKLAIAAYHDISDFWKINQLINSIRDDYEIYLRHYTEGWSETIMYFKPKNEK